MNNDSMIEIVDNITSVKPVIILWCYIVAVSFIIKFLFAMQITVEQCILIWGIYLVYTFIIAIHSEAKIKKFLLQYFPDEYSELYESDSITSIVRTPFGNLHNMMHINKVLDNSEYYDEILVRLYENIDSERISLLFMFVGGLYFIDTIFCYCYTMRTETKDICVSCGK